MIIIKILIIQINPIFVNKKENSFANKRLRKNMREKKQWFMISL